MLICQGEVSNCVVVFAATNCVVLVLQAEVDHNTTVNVDDDDLCFTYREFQEAEFRLGQDFQEFKKNTSDPVLELRSISASSKSFFSSALLHNLTYK